MQDHSNKAHKNSLEEKPFVSTRHRDAEPDTFDPSVPRLGRRESEPHSAEVTYLHDVLTANFPDSRTMWDLHHYFKRKGMDIDIQFDISFFKDLEIPYTLSSYNADQFNDKVPTMAINILSKSTWRSDIAEKLDFCRILKIPLYVIFPPYHVTINIYKPPFMRAYILQEGGEYKVHEVRKTISNKAEQWDKDAIIDVSDIVPFRLALQKREQEHQGEKSLYRLVLIDADKDEFLLTEKERIIEEKDRKLEEKDRKIEKLQKRLQKFENR
ncbi:MAG: Uma2 family endonuclease [Promethearchaeia archaeon]